MVATAPADPFPAELRLWRETAAQLDVVARVLVPGEPVAKERPRTVQTRGRDGRVRTRTYTPDDTSRAEELLAWEFRRQARGHRPGRGDVFGIACLFVTAITRDGQGSRGAKDGDNLHKLTLDALNAVAWVDDRYVEDVSYRVARGVPSPRTVLLVYRLPADHGGGLLHAA